MEDKWKLFTSENKSLDLLQFLIWEKYSLQCKISQQRTCRVSVPIGQVQSFHPNSTVKQAWEAERVLSSGKEKSLWQILGPLLLSLFPNDGMEDSQLRGVHKIDRYSGNGGKGSYWLCVRSQEYIEVFCGKLCIKQNKTMIWKTWHWWGWVEESSTT